uniref:Uncharacterized protein n=1 Tax=Arundo donax TaxID=35708 RepID=A0A0A9F2I3_ARUDO
MQRRLIQIECNENHNCLHQLGYRNTVHSQLKPMFNSIYKDRLTHSIVCWSIQISDQRTASTIISAQCCYYGLDYGLQKCHQTLIRPFVVCLLLASYGPDVGCLQRKSLDYLKQQYDFPSQDSLSAECHQDVSEEHLIDFQCMTLPPQI